MSFEEFSKIATLTRSPPKCSKKSPENSRERRQTSRNGLLEREYDGFADNPLHMSLTTFSLTRREDGFFPDDQLAKVLHDA